MSQRTSGDRSEEGWTVEPMVGDLFITYPIDKLSTLNCLYVYALRIRYLHGACTYVLARRGDIINMWTSSVQK